jgi:hypothetical protein
MLNLRGGTDKFDVLGVAPFRVTPYGHADPRISPDSGVAALAPLFRNRFGTNRSSSSRRATLRVTLAYRTIKFGRPPVIPLEVLCEFGSG